MRHSGGVEKCDINATLNVSIPARLRETLKNKAFGGVGKTGNGTLH